MADQGLIIGSAIGLTCEGLSLIALLIAIPTVIRQGLWRKNTSMALILNLFIADFLPTISNFGQDATVLHLQDIPKTAACTIAGFMSVFGYMSIYLTNFCIAIH